MDEAHVVAHPRARVVGDGPGLLLPRRGAPERHALLLPARGRGRVLEDDVPRTGLGGACWPPLRAVRRGASQRRAARAPGRKAPRLRPVPTGWWRPTAPWLAPRLPRPRSRARATGTRTPCLCGVVSRDSRQATLELKTGGFYALHEASGTVRVFVPGFDFPQDPQAAALPFRRALVDAVVGRRVQLGGVRALEQVSFAGLVPSALGKAEMQVARDGTVRAGRRALRAASPPHVSARSRAAAAERLPGGGEERGGGAQPAALRRAAQAAAAVEAACW